MDNLQLCLPHSPNSSSTSSCVTVSKNEAALETQITGLSQFHAPNYHFSYNDFGTYAHNGYPYSTGLSSNPRSDQVLNYEPQSSRDYLDQVDAFPACSTFIKLTQSTEFPRPQFGTSNIKHESETESSDESSSSEKAGGVIRRAQKFVQLSRSEAIMIPEAISILSPSLSCLIQREGNAPNPAATFCVVPGRLSLLSNAVKYKVTVGEIQRRINPPESLNASVLGGILRRAKSKDGGKSLRDQLKLVGLTLPAGRRKASNVNSLTALVECEANQLASDFSKLCESAFPSKDMATYVCALQSREEAARDQRRTMMIMTKQILYEFQEVLKLDTSEAGNVPSALDASIQSPLTQFSLITHGFGGPAVQASLAAFMRYLNDSLQILNEKTL